MERVGIMKKTILIKSVVLLALAIDGGVIAEERVTDFGSVTPTTNQFIEALTPQRQIKPPKGLMRGINIKRVPKSEEVLAAEPVAINLSLTFGFDAATLTNETKNSLNNLGEALKDSSFSTSQFRIEGHTDSTGDAIYNKGLSKRRADSVKKYLADNYGVSPDRLTIVGKGEEDLLDWDNPRSSSNRRVKIVNLGNDK